MPSLESVIQTTINGVATGSVYALLLFGVLLIFRVSKAINFAHGQIGMVAAFGSYVLAAESSMGLPLAIALGLLAAALISYLTNLLLVEPLSRKTSTQGLDLVVTLGVMLILTALAEQLLGNNTYSYASLGNRVQVAGDRIFVNLNQVTVALLAGILFVAFAWFMNRTPAGAAMRASASDRDLAASMGLNVARIRGLTWALSGLIGGVAAVVIASRLSVDAYYMTPFLIKAFIAGIVGGLDRFAFPLCLALALGVYEAWADFIFGAQFGTPAVFILVLALLSILPKRFLDERQEARA